jgi:hypothetical protein
MLINCGPAYDRRTLILDLPPTSKIGVLVSGGIDSALLYYLLLDIKQQTNSPIEITPIVIHRKEGSKHFARPIVERINQIFDIYKKPKQLGNTMLPEPQQVASAVMHAFSLLQLETVYVGVISNRPEHLIGFDPIPIVEHPSVQTPFKNLEKSHVVDIYYQLGIEHILPFTHSCDQHETVACGSCNGCRERAWGFNQIGKQDPITYNS